MPSNKAPQQSGNVAQMPNVVESMIVVDEIDKDDAGAVFTSEDSFKSASSSPTLVIDDDSGDEEPLIKDDDIGGVRPLDEEVIKLSEVLMIEDDKVESNVSDVTRSSEIDDAIAKAMHAKLQFPGIDQKRFESESTSIRAQSGSTQGSGSLAGGISAIAGCL